MTELNVRPSEVGGRAKRDIAWLIALERPNRRECAMKLTSAQVERTLGQFEARAIPDDHPVIPQLNDLFGEHTFFLDLSWSDDDPTGLELHEPEATDIVITLESRH